MNGTRLDLDGYRIGFTSNGDPVIVAATGATKENIDFLMAWLERWGKQNASKKVNGT